MGQQQQFGTPGMPPPQAFPGMQAQGSSQPDDIAQAIADCAEMARQAASSKTQVKPRDAAALQAVFRTDEDDITSVLPGPKKPLIPLPERDQEKKSRSRSRKRDRDRSRSRGR